MDKHGPPKAMLALLGGKSKEEDEEYGSDGYGIACDELMAAIESKDKESFRSAMKSVIELAED